MNINLAIILLLVLEAIWEGLYDRGYNKPVYIKRIWRFNLGEGLNLFKWLSKTIQCIYIVDIFLCIYLSAKVGWSWDYIAIYAFSRFSFFNYLNAIAAGRRRLLGTTSLTDRITYFLTLGNLYLYILLTIVAAVFLITTIT